MPFYIIIAMAAFMLTLIGTRLAIVRLRGRTPPLDVAAVLAGKPKPVPRGAGIVLVMACLIALLALDVDYGIILAMLLITAVALLGSLIELPFYIRLLVQIMAISIPLNAMEVGLFHPWLTGELDKLVTLAAWLGFIQLFTDIERTDGPCTITTIAIATGLSLIAVFSGNFPSALSVYGLTIASACAGFLWWNWPPAKVHMGETGAAPLGFLVGYLLMLAANQGYYYTSLILPAYLFAEGSFMLVRRLAFGKRRHLYFYEKALASGFTPAQVARYIIGVHILLGYLALRCISDVELRQIHVALAYLCVFMLMGFFAHQRAGAARHAR
jgi:UDP-N-acetylmuramyl pentapeptide phosphotransferase/UDP-N-acetylglucosamine-1-phosphate transferase